MKTLITALLLSLLSFINVHAQEAFNSSEMLAFNETTENYNAPDAEMSLVATFDGGTGTVDDPYQISTAVQLQAIGDNLSSHFVLTGNIDASNTSTWNSEAGFAPIGSSASPFEGSLDGKGYKISDLTISRSGEDYVGLFASIGTNGSVKNLGLDQASITGANYVGGLIGLNSGSVSYSYSTGSISGTSDVGGLVGLHSLNTVSYSYSTSTVTGTYNTGGFVGFSYDNIDNSFATGAVNGDDRVGGFIGEQAAGSITNSYSTGSVSGTSSVGGFVGYKFGASVSNSFWDTETSGTTAAAGAGNTTGMTGKTTAQMTTESTYTGAGWDFTSVWTIAAAVNGGYPSLLPEPKPPVFNSSATASVPENTLTTATVLDVNADDGNGGAIDAGITYSITGGADMGAFTIDAATGELTFAAVPDFENPADADANNDYELTVQADDGGTISNTATQDITITVTDVNEVPVFTSSAATSAPENTLTTTTVLDVDANDGDGGAIDAGITYSITGGADMGAFTIDAATGELTFAAVPDFENPTDADANNVYELTVQADDGSASNNTATQDITITVTDENEAPSLTLGATSGSLDENNTPPNVVTTITINDDALGTNTLSLSGADAGSFAINESNELEFTATADFETKSSYAVTVEVDDEALGTGPQDSQDFTLTINDVLEVPVFTSSASASTPENTPITTTVLNVDANDGDGGAINDGITYTIFGGADSEAFNIDGATGAITFVTTPDFENPTDADANNVYELTVQADDGSASNNTATQDITITVTDVNDAPTLTLGATSGSLDENNTPHNVLTPITINDDALGTNTLSLSGADAESFNINDSNELEFTVAADFETKNSYAVTVEVNDEALGTGPQDSQDFTLTINDVLEVPVFTSSATASAPENTPITTTVLDVDANDGDGGAINDGITYTIFGGADSEAFNIDGATGAITFAAVPDFENPTDADANNVYEITVQADDGSASNNTATQDVTITVTEVNDAPTLTLGATSGSLDENNTPPNVVTTITINDDALGTNTLSLSGADAGSFNINESNELEFTATADFETKSSYMVTVEVDDADLGTGPEDSKDFTLTINDVNEAPVVTNPIADFEVVENAPDSTFDLTHIFSDVDAGDVDLTYSVVTNTNPSLIDTLVDNSTNELTIIFQVDQAGTTELTIRATDSGGLTVDDTFTITVVLKKFYLADNDTTIMCPNAAVNETGEVNGVTYTKRTKEDITTENAATTCTSGITDMSEMFKAAETFNEDISHWDVSSVTNMSSMFYGTPFNQPIGNWDVSAVTDMSFMFANNRAFDKPLADWNVSSVTNMSNMFFMTPFNQPISDWVVLSVKDMTSMFYGNIRFNQEIGSWDVDSVTSMANMFFGAVSFNKPINDWDVSSVTNMYSMFAATRRVNIRFTPTSFNQPLDKWDVSNVTNMSFMFASSRFNQDLRSWNMESVTNTNAMFVNAYYFNNGFAPQQKSKSIDGVEVVSSLAWDVSNITNMAGMFQGAEAFNQDISSWNVSNVQYFDVAPDEATDTGGNKSMATTQPDSIAGFLVGSGMSSDNASKMFVEWSKRDLQDGASINIGAIELNEAGATAMKTMREANNMAITWGGQQGVEDKPVFTELPAPFEVLFDESRVLSLWDYVSDTATPDNELQFSFRIISDSAQTIGFDATSGDLSVTAPAYADTFRVAMQVRNNEGIASLDTLEVHSVSEMTTSIEEAVIPNEFVLKQNYPNPFNPTTTINYGVPEAGEVRLEVFDMLGRKVATLVNNEFKAAGTYSISFDASSLASGIYLYRIVSGKNTKIQKMTLVK